MPEDHQPESVTADEWAVLKHYVEQRAEAQATIAVADRYMQSIWSKYKLQPEDRINDGTILRAVDGAPSEAEPGAPTPLLRAPNRAARRTDRKRA